MNRREFIKNTALATAVISAMPYIKADSPSKKYKTALVGCGWWGNNILGEAIACGECKIVALCDVDQRFLKSTEERVKDLTGDTPKTYGDYRELLEKEKPEIVIIATPDHWHPLIFIDAVRHGAHVYVEKPISHTVLEGAAMVKAARAANRVAVAGTHRRVSPHNISAREFIRSGKLGKIGLVKAFVKYGGGPEKPLKNIDPPKELDWDMWCGPAPLRPYAGDIKNPWGGGPHPRGFRSYLDFANGQLGDWGVHWIDQIQWILDLTQPKRIFSMGGRPVRGPVILTDTEQTTDVPDHQIVTWEYENGTQVYWEHRLFAGNNQEKGENVGCYFYGTEGVLHLGWLSGWAFYPSWRGDVIKQSAQLHQPDDQNIKENWANFLECIKTGKRPESDIEAIYNAPASCLLGMLSLKLGRAVNWDESKCAFINDPEADALLKRKYRGSWEYPTI
ncbi:MAG: Gfo/Idh/MocA family oxidoreductase [Verrucomicrobia bacterium]|nr:Gfo/Idh/MocA family oxidoreductase [Verrucomicrobiota bacterium]